MSYSELMQVYFERSTALQWYWTVYIFVIGGVLAFSTFRLRPELVSTILVTALYCCFAHKNLGAIVETAEQREAIRTLIIETGVAGPQAAAIEKSRARLEPRIPEYDIGGASTFHIVCDLLTIAFVWAKEWRRRRPESPIAPSH